jgi:glycosyltransferase involved in cell wall biosynthesis
MDLRCLILGSPNPYGTGGERRSWHVLRAMAKFNVKLRLLVDRFCQVPFPSNLEVYRLKYPLRRFLHSKSAWYYLARIMYTPRSVKEIIYHIQDFRPDIVVSHDELPWNIHAAYLASQGKPWTAILNELPISFFYSDPSIREVIDWRECTKNIFKTILDDRNISVLNRTIPILVSKAIIIQLVLRGFKIDRYVTLSVPLGVNLDLIRKVKWYKDKCYDAIFIARLTPEKGIYDLVHIWKEVTKILKSVKLCIAGEYHHRRDEIKLRQLIADYKLHDNIKILGPISEEEKFSLMKSSKLFLYPSRQDSFSLTVLEALACGLPVVAYRIPAITTNYPTEVRLTAKIGDYKAMATNVIKLLTDYSLLNKLANSAAAFSLNYTWEEAAWSEVKAYEGILKSSELDR